MDMPNVFKSLSYYGSSQPENYLTESFVYVLQRLSSSSPPSLRQILVKLCDLREDDLSGSPQIDISTQSALTVGRPDIRIDIGERWIVFIEVKDWSPLGGDQLEKYHAQIQEEFRDRGKLVLLTRSRHSIQETGLEASSFHDVCWYEVHSWFSSLDLTDPLASHYVDEFLGFLEGKAMGVQKVTWEFQNGIRSMLILTNLLQNAVSELWPYSDVRRTAGWSWRGLYVDNQYFIGFRFDDPTHLTFENNQGTDPSYKLDLDFQEVHFHSLSAGEQLETITEFIKTARKEVEAQSEE